MNVATLTMPKEEAQRKLECYQADLHKDTEATYRACEEAYEALADGTPLIDIDEAILAGGFFPEPDCRPRLAIARADRQEVHVVWMGGNSHIQFLASSLRKPPASLVREVNVGRHHEQKYDGYARNLTGYAMVPMVPADVRPRTGQLRHWYVLWEVEQWAERAAILAPRDPYLLKHIGGQLYAVLAEWDLTEVERAVMKQLRVQ